MNSHVTEITDQEFEATVINSDDIVLVDFWAPWCGPCRTLGPILERIAEEFAGDIRVVKVNIDQSPSFAGQLGVRSVPSLFLFKKGEILDEMTGIPDPRWLVDRLEKALDETADGR